MGGLYVPQVCRDQFYYLMMKKQWRYIIYKVESEEKSSIEIDVCGLRDSTYEEFLESLPSDQPRWIIFDFEYEIKEYG